MSVHLDRAHHHPRVYKRLGYWQTNCPRCGLLPFGYIFVTPSWRAAMIAALKHSEVHS